MPSSSWLNPHKPLLWVLVVALAAAFFASGALVARATLDDDNDSPGFTSDPALRYPNTNSPFGPGATGAPGNIPAAFPGMQGMAESADGDDKAGAPAMDSYGRGGYWGGCRAPLPAGLLTANGIDLSGVDFEMNLPGEGYSLVSYSLSTYAECDEDGQPAATGELVLDTTWRHDETSLEVYISQRVDGDAVAPVLRQDWATFSVDGYVFSVNVNRWAVYPIDARDGGLPYPDGDPRATEVLNDLIDRLAPSIGLQCFWTEAKGDWSDIIAMGIGDPRGAIPSGYEQSDLWVTTFNEPAAGCDTTVQPTEGTSFNAGWSNGDGNYIGVSAWGMDPNYPYDYPGQISSWGANWSNNTYQFSVYVSSYEGRGGDVELVRAIARAIDPSYNEQCFIRENILSDSDLAGLGFNVPAIPDGFEITRSYHAGTDIAAGCDRPEGFAPYYNLSWTLTNGADTIDVSVSRYEGSESTGEGWISDYGINWSGTNGDYFSVNAWSSGISPVVDRDILIAIAESLDPNFDVDRLRDEPGGVKPLPVAEGEARSADAGGGSTGSAPDAGR